MKELEVWLKSIATGLSVLAEGIQTIAKMVDDMAKAQVPEKPEKTKPVPPRRKARPTSKRVAKKVDEIAKAQAPKRPSKAMPASKRKAKPTPPKVTKKAIPKGFLTLPATEKVLKVIKRSKKGVSNETISKKTGLKKNQVANALSQLKKTGKIKSIKRGVHKVA